MWVTLGRMPPGYKWSRGGLAGWKSTARLPGNVLECLLSSPSGIPFFVAPVSDGERVRELLALQARCRDGSHRYLAHSLFDSLLLFPAWFPSLPYPLKPGFTVAHFGFRVYRPWSRPKCQSPGVHFLDVVRYSLTYRTV